MAANILKNSEQVPFRWDRSRAAADRVDEFFRDEANSTRLIFLRRIVTRAIEAIESPSGKILSATWRQTVRHGATGLLSAALDNQPQKIRDFVRRYFFENETGESPEQYDAIWENFGFFHSLSTTTHTP